MHVLLAKMREFDHRSLSKDRVPLEAFRHRELKNEPFRSPLQSSTILSLMQIAPALMWGMNWPSCSNPRL